MRKSFTILFWMLWLFAANVVPGMCFGASATADAAWSYGNNGYFVNFFLVPDTFYFAGNGIGEGVDSVNLDIPAVGDAQPCPGHETVTDYDGNVYNTVKIGEQCWMKENLRTTHYADGVEIPDGTNAGYNYNISVPYRYNPGNNPDNVSSYGHLYNWMAAMHGALPSTTDMNRIQGACPAGWHLPSASEWTQLTDYVSSIPAYICGDSTTFIAKALASTTGWNSNNGVCTPGNLLSDNNITGFSAMPATCYGSWCGPCGGSSWCSVGGGISLWSSTPVNGNYYPSAIGFSFSNTSAETNQGICYRSHGYSVRCVLDPPCAPNTSEFSVTSCGYYTWNEQTYTESGDYTQTFTNMAGCDSVVTLHLNMQYPWDPERFDIYITDTGSYTWNEQTYTLSGDYYQWFTNFVGCDSLVILHLTIIPNGVAQPGDTLPCVGNATVTDYDGNVYNTVRIGQQCWMKENLRTTHYADGTEIPLGSSTSNSIAYRYFPNNSASNVTSHGYLYNWAAIMLFSGSSNANPSNLQGICPNGWHVPSSSEWEQLINYTSSISTYVCGNNNSYIAKSLASSSDWNSHSNDCAVGNNQTQNNNTGFSVLPTGEYYGSYNKFGEEAHFWTSTECDWHRSFSYSLYNDRVGLYSYCSNYKEHGFALRCVLGEGLNVPSVNTIIVSSIDTTTATCNSVVTSDGGSDVTTRGVCWSISQNPTTNDSHTNDGNGIGSFTSNLTGLEPNRTYYVRAYATNSMGTRYGKEIIFTTLGYAIYPNDGQPCPGHETVSDYDGNIYNTVSIGNQCWMRENLRTTHYANGEGITNHYYPNNDENNVSTYGYLYNWDAVTNGESNNNGSTSPVAGICPTGWHIPSDTDWKHLTDYVSSVLAYNCGGDSNNIAKALAANSEWSINNNNCAVGNNWSVNNITNFSALPSGFYNSYYIGFGSGSYFWSCTEDGESNAWHYHLSSIYAHIVRSSYGKGYCLSVRCLLDTSTSYPAVTTLAITEITHNTATCGGNVTYDGNTTITARGVCWSTSQNPTISDSHTADGSGTGTFTSSLTGLQQGTTYYVRAYATNSAGTAYGNEVSFTTLSIPAGDAQPCPGHETVTDYDGNTYNTVKIGQQCWMKENLRVTHYADGSEIPMGNSSSNDVAYRYSPNNDANNVATYGYLYNWTAVMHGMASSDANPSGVQGICPTGWHVPADAEWTQLTNYVSSVPAYLCNNSYIAKALAAQTGWGSGSNICAVGNNPGENNTSGFNALPAGRRSSSFNSFSTYSDIWSSTLGGESSAWSRNLNRMNNWVAVDNQPISHGFSVRCLLGDGVNLSAVTTDEASAITLTTATCGGNVTYDGNTTVTARGVCWSTSQNPTINNSHTNDGSGTGAFLSNLTGLQPNTTYYVRAYATNGAGTVYGNEVSFTTLSIPAGDAQPCPGHETVTDYDGNVYNTVKIGQQCWMKENLRVTHFADGIEIPITGTGGLAFNDPYRYAPNGDNSLVNSYGYLYNWAAVMHNMASSNTNPSGVQGVCPTGWHMPSDAEWTQLTNYVSSVPAYTCGGNSNSIAKALSATTGWSTSNITCAIGNDLGTNNITGFSAFPTGYRDGYAQFASYLNTTYFWCTSSTTSDRAAFRYFIYNVDTIYVGTLNYKSDGMSVRCLLGDGVNLSAVTTDAASAITQTTATCGGNVTYDGNTTVTARGVCWSTSQNPTINDSHTTDGSGTGTFTSILTGLQPSTTYYVRAYATNGAGTAYGNEVSFTTSNGITPSYVTISGDGSICQGQSATLSVASDVQGTFLWSNGMAGETITVSPSTTTTYYVTITTATGNALTSEPFQVVVNDTPNVTLDFGYTFTIDTMWKVCIGSQFYLEVQTDDYNDTCEWFINGVPIDTWYLNNNTWYYLWNNNTLYSGILNGLGWYNYSVKVTNNNGCTTQVGHPIEVAYDDILTPLVSVSPSDIFCVNDSVVFSVNYDEEENYDIYWNEVYTGIGSYHNPFVISYPSPNVYYYEVTVIDMLTGCLGYSSFEIEVVDCDAIPDGDAQPCPGHETVTDYDGNVYNTVKIGQQCWMKENLRTTHFADGVDISVAGNTTSYSIPYRYNPNNNANNVANYGYLYNWQAAMRGMASSSANPSGVQGICPTGWHVPSDAEWTQLTDYVSSVPAYVCGGDNTQIAKSLSASLGWQNNGSNCTVGNDQGTNNGTGFTAVQAGHFDNWYYNFGKNSDFWTTTEYNDDHTYYRSLTSTAGNVIRHYYRKYYGFAIRCLLGDGVNLSAVTTNEASEITQTSATCGGEVTYDGNTNVTARGVCWSTSPNPTLNDSHTTNGSGMGSFTSSLTGLQPSTTYYVRAYATNGAGTAYGNEVSFTTEEEIPACSITIEMHDSWGDGWNGNKILVHNNDTTQEVTLDAGSSGAVTLTVYNGDLDVEWVNGSYTSECSFTITGPCLNYSTTVAPSAGVFMNEFLNCDGGVAAAPSFTVSTENTCTSVIAYTQNNSLQTDEVIWQVRDGSWNILYETYNWDFDYEFTISGTYYITIFGINSDCGLNEWGRTLPLNLTMPEPITSVFDSVVCSNEAPIFWNGQSLSATGSYTVTLQNADGCDSTVTLNLYVTPSPVLTHTPDTIVHANVPITLWADGADNLVWTDEYGNFISNSNAVEVIPTESITYIVTGSNNSDNLVTNGDFEQGNTGFTSSYNYYSSNLQGFGAYTILNDAYNILGSGHHYGLGGSGQFMIVDGASTTNAIVWSETINVQPNTLYNFMMYAMMLSTANPTAHFQINVNGEQLGEVEIMPNSDQWRKIQRFWNSAANTTATITIIDQTNDGANNDFGLDGIEFAAISCETTEAVTVEVLSIPDGDAQPCPGHETVTDYDGNVYNTVQIGQQCWMKENLRTTHYVDGVAILSGSIPSYETPYRYSPNGNDNNAASYGYLYNWAAVMHGANSNNDNPGQVQGICPTGWHLPSSAEWDQLTNYVGNISAYQCNNNSSYIVKALASNEGWNYSSISCRVGNDLSSNNATGFSAMPAAYYGSDGSVGAYFHKDASFWSSTQTADDKSRTFRIYTPYAYPYFDIHLDMRHGLSVRCLLGDGMNLSAVTTDEASDITQTTATCGGNVTYDGNTSVTARGVCWSTSQNPTINDSHTTDDTGTGSFTSSLTGLQPNTTYYVRAYATNGAGTAYGNEVSFTTEEEIPACSITIEMHDSWGDGWNGNKILVHNNDTTQEVTLDAGSSGAVTLTVYNGDLDVEWVNGSYTSECSFTITGPCLNYSTTVAPSAGVFMNEFLNCDGGVAAAPSFTVSTENTCTSVIAYTQNNSLQTDEVIWQVRDGSWNILYETYNWDFDYEFTTSGTYYITLFGSNNVCGLNEWGRTLPLNLTMPEPITTVFDSVVCSNEAPISWNGQTLTETGTYTVMLQNADGCDSTVTLKLFVTPSPVLTHTPDTIVHANVPVTLWADGADNLVWTDEYGNFISNSNTVEVIPTESITYFVTGSNNSDNLVTNGDFEQGNTGFTTGYTYAQNGNCRQYHIGHENHEMWSWDTGDTIFDHTGNGMYMMVDAYSGYNIWSQTVNVTPQTNYVFSAWFVTDNIANVKFEINDASGEIFTTPQQRGVWEKRQFVWNSGSNTTATLKITTGSAQCSGHDFGIDDIGFAAISCATTEAVTVNVLSIPDGDAQPCPGHETVTDYDGNVYNTVKIGQQCWMKENLRTTHYEDGIAIPKGGGSYSVAYWYYPNNDASTNSTYGLLYNNPAVKHGAASSSSNPSGVQGICPFGWHVPSEAEWNQLTNYVKSIPAYQCNGNSNYIAKSLASTEGWNSDNNECAVGNNTSTNNATGFSALPALSYGFYSSYWGTRACFWSSTQEAYRSLNISNSYVTSGGISANVALAVRCVLGMGYNPPAITTAAVNNVTLTSATCGGNVTYDGNTTVTARGVCWSTSQSPTISDNYTIDGSDTGSFTSNLTGLQQGTTYYLRAYATNSAGTAYGNEVSFTTLSIPAGDALPCPGHETVTDYDGNTYNTVKIGQQCWMKENLRTTHYADGTSIIYNYYINPNVDAASYGYYYNWPAAMNGAASSNSNPSDVQGVCPNGWHLPSDEEWTQLSDYVSSMPAYHCNDNSSNIAKALASTTIWESNSNDCAVGNNPTINNATGFSAVPAGIYANSSFSLEGESALFASSTELTNPSGHIWIRVLYNHYPSINRGFNSKSFGHSVRCLLNPPCTPNTSEFSATSCGDYTWNGQTYTVSGDYTQTLTNIGGCDSVVTLHLTILPVTTLTHTPDTIVPANVPVTLWASGANQIVWTDANGNVLGEGASLTVTPSDATTYTVTALGTGDNLVVNGDFEQGNTGFTTDYSYSNYMQCRRYTIQPDAYNYLSDTHLNGIDGNNLMIVDGYNSSTAVVWSQNVNVQPGMLYALSAHAVSLNINTPFAQLQFLVNGTPVGVLDVNRPKQWLKFNGTWNSGDATTATLTIIDLTNNCANNDFGIDGIRFAPITSCEVSETVTVTALPAGDALPCPDHETVTDIDGNTYNTVQIGEQCWMKENLRTTHYADGTNIPAGGSNTSNTDPFYYINPNLDAAIYGYYYNWPAAMHGTGSSNTNPSNVQGVCPNGWHLPSYAEWAQLTSYVGSRSEYTCGGSSDNIGKALASVTGWQNSNGECYPGDQSIYANNATGFSAVPASHCLGSWFYVAGHLAYFWSSWDGSSVGAYLRYLSYNAAEVGGYNDYKKNGFSVRCVLGDGCTTQNTEFSATSCDDYTWNGQTYTVSGDYTQTLTNVGGCDSVVTLHLTVHHPVHTAVSDTACDGVSYLWHSTIYTASGDYTYSHADANGCTQVDTLHLTITNTNHTNFTDEVCDSYTWNGQTYTVSGDYTQTLTNVGGCDSVVTLHLTIHHPVHTATSETACGSYTWHGTTYTASGHYTYSHTDANGCTQVDTLHLTIHPYPSFPVITASATTVCEGSQVTFTATNSENNDNYTYIWYGDGVEIPGANLATLTLNMSSTGNHTYTAKSISPYGCESMTLGAPVMVTVSPGYTVILSGYGTVCEDNSLTLTATVNNMVSGDALSYQWYRVSNGVPTAIPGTNSATYTTAALMPVGLYDYYVIVSGNIAGCSAISDYATVNVVPTVTTSISESICAGDSYDFFGEQLTTSGIYTYTLQTVNGCDSVVMLNLTVKSTATGDTTATACNSFTWHGVTCTQSGDYTRTLTAANGCDSVVTLHLTINQAPQVTLTTTYSTICDGGNTTLYANVSPNTPNMEYTWYRNGVELVLYNLSELTVNDAGSYRVKVSSNGCSTMSDPLVVTVNSAPQVELTATETTICTGGSTVITAAVSNNDPVNYYWSYDSYYQGSTYTFTPPSAGTYTFYVTADQTIPGCAAVNSIIINVNDIPAPPVIIVLSDNICDGNQGTLTIANAQVGATYTWLKNGTVIPGAITSTYTETLNALNGSTTDYTYSAFCTVPGSGCVSNHSSNAVIHVVPYPTASVTVTENTICEGGMVILTANVTPANGTYSYQWYKENTLIPGATSSQYEVLEFARTEPYSFSLNVTSDIGCVVTATAPSITVVPDPVVTATLSGSSTFCQGGTATITSSVEGGVTGSGMNNYTYQWRLLPENDPYGNPQPVGTGSTFTTSSNDAAGSYTYQLVITGALGCASGSNPVTISIVSDPVVTISRAAGYSATVCEGGETMLRANVSGGLGTNTYQWYKNGSLLTGMTTSTLHIDNLAYGANDTYTVMVTQSGTSCANSASANLNTLVTVVHDYTATISGNGNVCEGGTITLNASVSNTLSGDVLGYQWYRMMNGGEGMAISGATSASYTTSDLLLAGSYDYYVVVSSNISGCGVTSSYVPANVVPDPVVTLQSVNSVCAGNNLTLSAFVSGGVTGDAYSYAWELSGVCNGVWQISNPNFTYEAYCNSGTAPYYFTVTISRNDNTGCNATSAIHTVSVLQPSTSSFNATACNSYSWSGTTYTQSGDYTKTFTNAAGCDSVVTLHLTIAQTPSVSISGNTSINYGNNITLMASGASSYAWSTGATTASITVSPTSTTTYTVTGTSQYGCTATATKTVTVNPVIPTVTTNEVSNVGFNSASSGGNITSNGGANVTARGVCWSTSPNPTVNNSHTSDGSGTGPFASSITGLTPNTTYYLRAYATNSAGTAYGATKTFTTPCNSVTVTISGNAAINYGQSVTLTASGASTYAWSTGATSASITVSPTVATTYTVTGTNQYGCTATASKTITVNPVIPTVTTDNVTNVGTNAATSGGNVTSDGGASVTARGVCWSTSPDPTVNNSHTMNGGGTGNFTSNVTSLTPNTTYYLRAYATNSVGTAYGTTKTFTTTCNSVSVTIIGNDFLDYGQSLTLTASGTNSYLWSTGESTASITVSPTATTTYSVTGTNQYGCTATATKTITVHPVVPTITTNEVSNVGTNAVTSGGNVISDGGAYVTARGVCWSTSHNPTVYDIFTPSGSGTGYFTSTVTGLSPNTTYYLRAYATNSAGTAYGQEVSFTTLCDEVSVSIDGDTSITRGQRATLTASGAYSYMWSTGASSESITVSPSATTTYTVTGTNEYGCWDTASWTVTVIQVDASDAYIYPNPAIDVFYLHIVDTALIGGSSHIFFYDAVGHRILHAPVTDAETRISCAGLTQGVYFLELNKEGLKVKTFKVIIK